MGIKKSKAAGRRWGFAMKIEKKGGRRTRVDGWERSRLKRGREASPPWVNLASREIDGVWGGGVSTHVIVASEGNCTLASAGKNGTHGIVTKWGSVQEYPKRGGVNQGGTKKYKKEEEGS